MADVTLLFVSYISPSVEEQPVVNLKAWRVIRMEDKLFLVGFTRESSKLRATSPVKRISRDRTVITSSGRLYHLEGEPGDPRQTLVWPRFHLWPWTDVTEEVQSGFDLCQ